MSNRFYVDGYKTSNGTTITVHDDYGRTFVVSEQSLPDDDGDLLRLLDQEAVNDDVWQSIRDHVLENNHGMEIRGTWYNEDEVRGMLLSP